MNKKQKVAPYGSWCSPITAELVARKSVRFGDVAIDGDDIHWVESRPAENGRSVIVQHTSDGKTVDILPPPFSARSRVHEYGGGTFAVHEGIVFFVNFEDQQIYRKDRGSVPYAITQTDGCRYADLIVDKTRNSVMCVQEAHAEAAEEPTNTIVSIGVERMNSPRILISGNDFYSSPRLSPDGRRLAWLTWNHPHMPWDGTELWMAGIDDAGKLIDPRKVAGGVSESIFQPEWSPDGMLYFVSDRNGWWKIHRYIDCKVEIVTELDAEFGMPQWNFGLSTFGFIDRDLLACVYNQKGIWHLATVDLRTLKMSRMETQYSDITHLRTTREWVVFYGGSPTEGLSVIKHCVATGETHVIRRSEESSVDSRYVSRPELIEFDTANDLKAYGFFYPPRNKDYVSPPAELPPLIVVMHGGPTSCSYTSLDLKILFWTSRGFAVFDVNHRGSTGFGRPYRELLNGNWGVVDVDDCVNGALYLMKEGLVDGKRLIIRGGSAGGYTTLAALTFRDVFKAGASYYGVSDLEALARETHKFEAKYLDSLIGPYPDAVKTYRERSPINYTGLLSEPIIFFQGLDDKVVPPNQAERMVEALRERRIPVAYIAFEGEQHGFRKSESLKRCLEAELYFYSRIFGFEISDKKSSVHIENL